MPCTLGVRFPKRTWHFTPLSETLCHKRLFRTLTYGCVKLPDGVRNMAVIGCVGSAASHCARLVRLQKCTWHFTPLWGPFGNKRHFSTPAVCIYQLPDGVCSMGAIG